MCCQEKYKLVWKQITNNLRILFSTDIPTCGNGLQVLPDESLTCDGIRHCSDGSDEGAECSKMLFCNLMITKIVIIVCTCVFQFRGMRSSAVELWTHGCTPLIQPPILYCVKAHMQKHNFF